VSSSIDFHIASFMNVCVNTVFTSAPVIQAYLWNYNRNDCVHANGEKLFCKQFLMWYTVWCGKFCSKWDYYTNSKIICV